MLVMLFVPLLISSSWVQNFTPTLKAKSSKSKKVTESEDSTIEHVVGYSENSTVHSNSTTPDIGISSVKTGEYTAPEDQVRENDSTIYNLNPRKIIWKGLLSEVIGPRIKSGSADPVLKVKFNIKKYDYDDWKSWVTLEENSVYCQSSHHCAWISNDIECLNITLRQTNAAWFGSKAVKNLGECTCPDEFDLGFSWKQQKCVKMQEPWAAILGSIAICLVLTTFILFLAFSQDMLVALGMRQRSLSTPNNSRLRSYSSIQN